jgi:chromosomal replication initiator protein
MMTGKRIKRTNSLGDNTSTPFRALNPKYTFDQYVADNSNQLAHTAALAVSGNPGSIYNLLVICGKQGMGSTHLLNAIGHRIKAQLPEKAVGYCSAERFVYVMGVYQRQNKLAQFRELFRELDVLLIDDIQFIANNPEYHEEQKELFHIIHDLHDLHKQICITADNHPMKMHALDTEFRSFLTGGMVIETQPLDVEAKSAILGMKADITKIKVPDDVINFLTTYNSDNIRELEGLLYRLGAYCRLQHIPITMKMARKYMMDVLRDVTARTDDVLF